MFGFDEWLQSSHALETAACPSFLRGRCSTLSSFRVGSKLGEGAHSKVYHAVHKVSAQSVALKVYGLRVLRDEKMLDLVKNEISYHSSALHDHILALYAAFVDSDFLVLVLEYAADGDLLSRMNSIPRDERIISRLVAAPLLSAIAYLHARGLAHRDVKPENIFIKGSHVLLGDLGFCKGFGDGARLSSCVGTVQFMAPEIIQNCTGGDWSNRIPKDDRDPYSEHIDVWALGVLVYELLSRSLPFRGDDTQAVCDAILSSSLALPSGISDECADFLSHALSRDPAFRPPAIVLLHHPFITAHISPPSLSKLVRAATSGREAVPVMSNDSTAALPVSTSSLHVDSAWERPDGPLPMRRSEQYAAGMRGPSEGCQPTSQAPSQQVSGAESSARAAQRPPHRPPISVINASHRGIPHGRSPTSTGFRTRESPASSMHGSVANYPLLRRGTMGSSVGEGATWHGRVQPREVWASWLGSGPVMYTASVGMAPSLCGGDGRRASSVIQKQLSEATGEEHDREEFDVPPVAIPVSAIAGAPQRSNSAKPMDSVVDGSQQGEGQGGAAAGPRRRRGGIFRACFGARVQAA